LANASYLENDIKIKGQAQGVIICPGPNMAYFDQEVSLSKMIQHIYGNANVLQNTHRPNMFVKELIMYVDYLKKEVLDISNEITAAQIKKLNAFKSNLLDGISYYEELFLNANYFEKSKITIQNMLHFYKTEITAIQIPVLELAS
jgi:hypothetical protein